MNTLAGKLTIALTVATMIFAGVANAGSGQQRHKKKDHEIRHDLYEYATVLEARPLYREVKVSEPLRECRDEPVYHTHTEQSSVGGMLAGGLIGGVIGHQIGGGRGNKIATGLGVLLGARVGHQAVNGDARAERTIEGYEEHCITRYRVSYREVVDGYDVTYEYRGREYQLVMPYDPGKYIKMRIEFAPVI